MDSDIGNQPFAKTWNWMRDVAVAVVAIDFAILPSSFFPTMQFEVVVVVVDYLCSFLPQFLHLSLHLSLHQDQDQVTIRPQSWSAMLKLIYCCWTSF
jgi:hypothetical protein